MDHSTEIVSQHKHQEHEGETLLLFLTHLHIARPVLSNAIWWRAYNIWEAFHVVVVSVANVAARFPLSV